MSFLFCCAVEYYSVLKVSRAGKQVKSSYVVGIVAVFVTFQVSGHHSGTIFDRNSIVTLVGTVTHYDWTNPHVYVYLEVRDAGGELHEWQLELDATAISMRSGWTSNTLIPGDIVTVRGNPDRRSRNRNHALLISLRTPDGTILEPRTGGRASNVRATGIGGVWDGLRGANTRTYIYGELTEKAIAAQADYEESDNPTSECVAFPSPTIVSAPYLHEIEVRDDRVFIRTELFNVERTVFMDGRGHPGSEKRTNQGHSIGWWEGDILVVETINFSDSRSGNRNGIPSGAQKRVVERFELSEDRTQLVVSYTVEDPEHLVDPMTGSIPWDYVPDGALSPFDCDPNIASRYIFD